MVGLVHFEADRAAVARERGRFGGLEQHAPPPRVRPYAAPPRSNRAAPPRERGRNSTIAVPASRPSPASAHDHLRGRRLRKCRRLRRDSRSVANTRCSSSMSASRSPRSALRTRMSGAGAWARLDGIVTNGRRSSYQLRDDPAPCLAAPGAPPAHRAKSPPARAVKKRLNPFAAGRDTQGCAAAKSRRDQRQQQQSLGGRVPAEKTTWVVIGACAPIHPRVDQSGPPG